MNLRDIRIGQRLTLGFGLVITLLVLLAVLALVRIQSLSGEVTSLVDETYPRTVMANRMKADLNEVSRSMLSILVMSDEGQINGELANIEKYAKETDLHLAKLGGFKSEVQHLQPVRSADAKPPETLSATPA